MESLQSYGVYLIVLGGLLIIAGLIMGYITTLPSETSSVVIPPREHANTTVPVRSSESLEVNASIPETLPMANTTNVDHKSVVTPAAPPVKTQENTSGTGSINIDVIDKLDRLTRLREQGVISVEQYEALRKQLLES